MCINAKVEIYYGSSSFVSKYNFVQAKHLVSKCFIYYINSMVTIDNQDDFSKGKSATVWSLSIHIADIHDKLK